MSFVSAVPSQGSCSSTTTLTCALGSLAVGATATVQVNVIAAATGYNINNTVSVSTTSADANPGNNSATATITVLEPLVLADLAASMAALQNPVSRRSNITYTVTVKNTGPNPAEDVLMTDILPDNPVVLVSFTTTHGSCVSGGNYVDCRLGNMAVGETATMTITVKPRYRFTFLKYTNIANVSSKTKDNNTVNNKAAVTVSVK
jgi:uncharacterized repeat protein (TIGR01451 family)